MTGPMRFSVIIPTFNSAPTLQVLLVSLDNQKFRDFEVIVVDDGSTDETESYCAGRNVRYEQTPTRSGPASARNRGAEVAQGEWLVFSDADTVFEPSTLTTIDEIIRGADGSAYFGTYAGKAANPESLLARYKALWEHYAIVMPFLHRDGELHPMTTWVPRPGVVEHRAFDSVNGFDVRFRGADLEDLEFGYRLHAAGFPIYFAENLQIRHHYPTRLRRGLRSFSRRAAIWMRLALRRRRMDPAGEGAPRQALAHACGFATIIAALVSPWAPPLGFFALGGFVCYAGLNAPFVGLALREEGPAFALTAFGLCWLYTAALGFGAVWGLVTGLSGRR